MQFSINPVSAASKSLHEASIKDVTPFIFFAHLAPSDYTSISPALIFSNNSPMVQAVQVPIVNDSILELSEVFMASLSLGNSNDHVKLMPNLISITINDDDGTILQSYSVTTP